MPYGVKLKGLGGNDMKEFAFLPKTRDAVIAGAEAGDVDGEFVINQKAKALHPDYQVLTVREIIDHTDAKTYILGNEDGSPVAYFKAGQYLSLQFVIDNSIITRPYSISSSPQWSLLGKYAVTIRRNPGGFAADKIIDTLRTGDKVIASAPEGSFFYDSIRDGESVIALAGGSGITPFLSMAYAIRDGIENFNLTIIYGSRNDKSILFKDELRAIANDCAKVKVVHVLSEETREDCESGFITAELISKYMPSSGTCSVFMCGPEAMYNFVGKEVEKLNIDRKFIRKELQSVTKDVASQPGYPAECKDQVFNVRLNRGNAVYEFSASANEPVLVAIERAGIPAPSACPPLRRRPRCSLRRCSACARHLRRSAGSQHGASCRSRRRSLRRERPASRPRRSGGRRARRRGTWDSRRPFP